MPTLLTIEVSDELLQRLRQSAKAQGKTAELLAAEYLANLTHDHSAGAVRRWIGAWASNVLPMPRSVMMIIWVTLSVGNWANPATIERFVDTIRLGGITPEKPEWRNR